MPAAYSLTHMMDPLRSVRVGGNVRWNGGWPNGERRRVCCGVISDWRSLSFSRSLKPAPEAGSKQSMQQDKDNGLYAFPLQESTALRWSLFGMIEVRLSQQISCSAGCL